MDVIKEVNKWKKRGEWKENNDRNLKKVFWSVKRNKMLKWSEKSEKKEMKNRNYVLKCKM